MTFTIKLRGASSFIAREFDCSVHGVFGALVSRDRDVETCPHCGEVSLLTCSAPAVHTQFVVSSTQGKSDAKPHPMSIDTRPLAEGMPLNEWRKERKKLWENERHRRVKSMLE